VHRRWLITCAVAQVSRKFIHAPVHCRVLSRASSLGGPSGLTVYLTGVALSAPDHEMVSETDIIVFGPGNGSPVATNVVVVVLVLFLGVVVIRFSKY